MSDRVEQRRHARVPVNTSASFTTKGQPGDRPGLCKDISLGGTFLETDQPAPFRAEVTVHVHLPGASETMALPGVVRWVRDGGMGIQFGLLGARETHAIIEIGRKADRG